MRQIIWSASKSTVLSENFLSQKSKRSVRLGPRRSNIKILKEPWSPLHRSRGIPGPPAKISYNSASISTTGWSSLPCSSSLTATSSPELTSIPFFASQFHFTIFFIFFYTLGQASRYQWRQYSSLHLQPCVPNGICHQWEYPVREAIW